MGLEGKALNLILLIVGLGRMAGPDSIGVLSPRTGVLGFDCTMNLLTRFGLKRKLC